MAWPGPRGLPGLVAAAARYVAERPGVPGHGRPLPLRVAVPAEVCEPLGIRIAAAYERAETRRDIDVLDAYRGLAAENIQQFHAAIDAGVRVVPWRRSGQPYRNSADLRERVLRTGTLAVYLTRDGHGPGPGDDTHPMRQPSPIVVDGVRLCHNDVFRAVHDLFGHVMPGNGFGPGGEFAATWCHLRMYPPDVHPVLFAEQLGQISWFYYGPHLLGDDGRPRRPGDHQHVPPSRRPYPEQKTVLLDSGLLDDFRSVLANWEEA